MEAQSPRLTTTEREAEIIKACRQYKEAGRPAGMLKDLVDLIIRHTVEAQEGSCRFQGFACAQLGDKAENFSDLLNALLDRGRHDVAEGRDLRCSPDIREAVGEQVRTLGV